MRPRMQMQVLSSIIFTHELYYYYYDYVHGMAADKIRTMNMYMSIMKIQYFVYI